MKIQYKEWIHQFLYRINDPTGKCRGAVEDMKAHFPELKIEKGYVVHPFIQPDTLIKNDFHGVPHWWLIDEEGSIVDPTESQFPKPLEYSPYSEELHGLLPVGKCMECGDLFYPPKEPGNFCDEECSDRFMETLK